MSLSPFNEIRNLGGNATHFFLISNYLIALPSTISNNFSADIGDKTQ